MLEPEGHIQGRTMLVRTPSEKNIFQFSPDKDRLSNGNFGTTFKVKVIAHYLYLRIIVNLISFYRQRIWQPIKM